MLWWISLLGLVLPPQAPDAVEPWFQATVHVAGAEATTFDLGAGGANGLKTYGLTPEARDGVRLVVAAVGRSDGTSGSVGLSVYLFVHFYADGTRFIEGQILNDAMVDPPGRVEADYRVSIEGDVVLEGHRSFADETGIGFHGGKPRFVPRIDLLTRYRQGIPDPDLVTGVSLDDANAADDPDPVKNTHQTGSPRNRWHCVQAVKYLFTEDDRYLDRLMDFVDAQARRPYHLGEPNGEPFFEARYPTAFFVEGRPLIRDGRASFGRGKLPKSAFDADGYNGWDHEHMNAEELFAAYMMFGSRIARRDLVLIAEQLLTTSYAEEEGRHQHSARAYGWVARMFVRAYQATGEERYLDAFRRMTRSLKVSWVKGEHPGLVPQPARRDIMGEEKWEFPFHVAVATSALALYLREVRDDAEALEMLQFCADLLVDRGYCEEKGGFYYAYSVESDRKAGDGSQTNGVAFWPTSPLVDAGLLLKGNRLKYLKPAARLWNVNRTQPWGLPSSATYHGWFLSAAGQFQDQR